MSDTLPLTVSETNILVDRGYYFNRLLGEGSYAKVWLVNYLVEEDEDASNAKDYSLACKIIDSKKAPRDFVSKFLPREMDVLIKISHPHLIHLHSIYQRKTKFFIFMRFAERGDLLDHLLNHGEVKERQCRLWSRQLALGLQYLHNIEIVHRDIKCENVLITANNNVKLADFGFSRFMVDYAGKRFMSSTYCGSLAYAAPELLKGKPYDPKRSDVWSLGIVLYVMLNQCMPFNDNDMNKLYEMQVSNKWSFRSKISQILSEEVKALISSMMTPDALRRIIIDDVVNHRWFSRDDRLRIMTSEEREALEVGISNRTGLFPKSMRMSIPSWKKRRKDEQIVCMTSLRLERASKQFQFESTSPKPVVQQKDSYKQLDVRRIEMRKSEDRYKRRESKDVNTKDSTDSNIAISLKPKATTSSVALIEDKTADNETTINDMKVRANIPSTSNIHIQPKAGETMTELNLDGKQNTTQTTDKNIDEMQSISSDEL